MSKLSGLTCKEFESYHSFPQQQQQQKRNKLKINSLLRFITESMLQTTAPQNCGDREIQRITAYWKQKPPVEKLNQ